MKQSITPTEYILVLADAHSDWDSCDFIIIHYAQKWIELTLQRLTLGKQHQANSDFCRLSFYENPVGFFIAGESESPIIDSLKSGRKDRCFINIEQDEIDNLEVPETQLDCHLINFDGYGNTWYTAVGKYSNEQFFATYFRLNEFLNFHSQQ